MSQLFAANFLDLIDFTHSFVIAIGNRIGKGNILIFFSVKLVVKAYLKPINCCFPSDEPRNSGPVFIITRSDSVHWLETRTIQLILSCHRANDKSVCFIDFKASY